MNHRWLARGLVAALHLALLAALWAHRPPRPADGGERRLTAVRLIAPTPARQPPSPRAAPAPQTRAPELPGIAPMPFTTDATATPAAPPLPADPAEPPPRTALRLTLPPGYAASAAARNPALSDPRSHTARRTLEDRIADAAAATGDWVAERTSDHRTLLRRGDTCVEVLRSRIADMDRFNENVAPRAVSMMGKPYKCR